MCTSTSKINDGIKIEKNNTNLPQTKLTLALHFFTLFCIENTVRRNANNCCLRAQMNIHHLDANPNAIIFHDWSLLNLLRLRHYEALRRPCSIWTRTYHNSIAGAWNEPNRVPDERNLPGGASRGLSVSGAQQSAQVLRDTFRLTDSYSASVCDISCVGTRVSNKAACVCDVTAKQCGGRGWGNHDAAAMIIENYTTGTLLMTDCDTADV